ncbi:hypothetical protein HJC23_007883 [Cyclotella cryptica]|uniref:Uncharacterized protein n=1 Tax=Cyclotella cryptica TaxID=29204 RepID=A0ABD3R0W3_9STRA|eukprot:CCRYP_000213-RA/>CCRYP_000213-RA protein AED:0.13 eAED:0.13 QI:0/-1/0/1/-1/1/1/0/756
MTMANAANTISKQRPSTGSYLGERRGSSSSTAASSSMDSTPESQGKPTPMAPIYAEELANRLIAFAQKGAEGHLTARRSLHSEVPPSGIVGGEKGNPLPPPILKPAIANTGTRPARSRVPPPPPPPRNKHANNHGHDDVETLSSGRTRSSSFDARPFKHQQSTNSDFNNSSSSLFKHQQSINEDFNGHSSAHFNASSASLSTSREFNRATSDHHDIVARKVRVTQFNDEPDRHLESSESLPSTCDKKGRCIHHSSVRLYKKQLLGGFQLVLESCPLCADETVTDELSHQTSLSRPTIVIKRSLSADRRRSKSMERKSSTEYIRSSSLERKVSLLKNSPPSPTRPRLSRGAASESDACPRLPNASSFLEDKRSKYLEIGPSSEYSRSLSSERNAASSKGSPIHASRPKLSRKALSESDTAWNSQSESPFIGDDHGSKSILERGLGKLSLLHGKDRSSSRHRGGSDGTTNRSSSRSRSDATSPSHHGQKSKPKRQFDSTGRCKKHPSIILARKKPFSKGWDTIRDSCPFCDEAGSEISASKMKSLLSREKGGATANDFNASHQSITSSSSCVRSTTEAVRRKNSLDKFDYPNSSKPRKSKERLSVDRMPTDASRVQKMPYTTPWGESGWYTGEVDDTLKPHGQGRMRYKTGYVFDGSWINGYSEQYLEKQKRMKSGFGSNVAPWKQNATSPHYDASPRPQPVMTTSTASSEMPALLQYQGQMQYSNTQWPSQSYSSEGAQQYWQPNASQSPGRYPYTS